MVLKRNIPKLKTVEKSSEKILSIIKDNPEISAKEIAKKIRISSRAVEKNIANLKKQSLIRRIGPDKEGMCLKDRALR